MRQELLSSLDEILNSTTSIKLHVDRVYDIRVALEQYITDEDRVVISNSIKSRVQKEAEQAFPGWGAAYMATGSGKSKIAIDIVDKSIRFGDTGRILLSVPTEKLRDENWKEEFDKWGMLSVWDNNVERTCYASLNKYTGEHFSLVILDEGHNITENNSEFFKNNKVDRCILLTATKPKDNIKLQILRELNIHCFFELSLDESVKLGLVAPYDITIVTISLDNVERYIKAGSKIKPFLNTEKAQYGYLSAKLNAAPNKMGFIDRMRFIYTLKSKTRAAKLILDNVIPKDLRTLIFCGSKDQAIQLCDRRFFSKPTYSKYKGKITPYREQLEAEKMKKHLYTLSQWEGDAGLTDFKEGKINRLSCVAALNEGHNIPNMDVGFVVQLDSNELNLIQRIGRLVRFRPGHIGKIIILCVSDSIDKTWVEKAIANLNVSNIEWIELNQLKTGVSTILFE